MNSEVAKIRESRNESEEMIYNSDGLGPERINEIVFNLNSNTGYLYYKQYRNEINIDEFVSMFIKNMYGVLDAFIEIGVYPDYFYNEIVKMNIDYHKIVNDNELRGKYNLFKNTDLSVITISDIRRGVQNKYYNVQALPKKDINDAFIEMISLFEKYGIPYNIRTEEQCKKVFNDIYYNLRAIMDQLLNSDDIYDIIGCLSRLLFEYMTFFVSLGINPKEYIDEYIEQKANESGISK